jgi:hypothetical protein
MSGVKNFNPEKDIPSLSGKIIFVTGGSLVIGFSRFLLTDTRPKALQDSERIQSENSPNTTHHTSTSAGATPSEAKLLSTKSTRRSRIST